MSLHAEYMEWARLTKSICGSKRCDGGTSEIKARKHNIQLQGGGEYWQWEKDGEGWRRDMHDVRRIAKANQEALKNVNISHVENLGKRIKTQRDLEHGHPPANKKSPKTWKQVNKLDILSVLAA